MRRNASIRMGRFRLERCPGLRREGGARGGGGPIDTDSPISALMLSKGLIFWLSDEICGFQGAGGVTACGLRGGSATRGEEASELASGGIERLLVALGSAVDERCLAVLNGL